MNRRLQKQLDFCTIEIYDRYLITRMNEGITVTPEHNAVLVELAETYFKGVPFGYITHRINSYSVNPSVYVETSKIENLAAFAIVAGATSQISTIEIEKLFLSKPVKQFPLVEEAVAWVEDKVASFTK